MKNMLYKLRFIPLVLGLTSLSMGIVITYRLGGGRISLIFGILLSVAGFIFLQAMRQLHAEKLQEQTKQTTQDIASNVVLGASESDFNSLHEQHIIQTPATIKFMKDFERLTIPGFDEEGPEILIYRNGTTVLLFQFFPPENEQLAKLVTENFPEKLAQFIGAKVVHEDRELFRIDSSKPEVICKLQEFFSY